MSLNPGRIPFRNPVVSLLLVLAVTAGTGSDSSAQSYAPDAFPRIRVWAFPGAFQDSTQLYPYRCAARGALSDSVREQPRTITVRFLRDRLAERRPDFGGYRIYRAFDTPDTAKMVLVRRFSVNPGDEITWRFSRVDSATLELRCDGQLATDSVITFVDPDSNGAFFKVCRRVDHLGRCLTPGDSIWKLVAPPGPHDGFRAWYAVTYEALNTADNNFEDLLVPDTSGNYARCGTPGVPATCPNLNHKALNVLAEPVEATAGPARDLETVAVVPNPFRASEAWDRPDGNEVHFINLPARAEIRIYTVAGELVRELRHDDQVRDFARWDLKNASGRDVASGIYTYRVVAAKFAVQNRFIVIR